MDGMVWDAEVTFPRLSLGKKKKTRLLAKEMKAVLRHGIFFFCAEGQTVPVLIVMVRRVRVAEAL